MLEIKFAAPLTLLLANDELYAKAFKYACNNYNELGAKFIKINYLREAFVFKNTEEGREFWEQKSAEYETAEFTPVSPEELKFDTWYADVDDLDYMVHLRFIDIKEDYPGSKNRDVRFEMNFDDDERTNYQRDENMYVCFNYFKGLKFYKYESKKQG